MLKQNFLRSLWLWMLFIVVGNVGAQNVAKIGTTEYATLQAAIDAAAKGKTVTLMQDVAENVVVADNKSLTIDLGGCTLNGKQVESTPTVKNQGTLTLMNGKIRRSGEGSASWYVIENEGTITMNTGLDVEGSANASLIRNNAATAKMTISAGTYTQTGAFIVVKNDLGTVTINGGTFSTASDKNVLNNWDQMTINGGTFNGNILNGAYDKDNNALTINAGTFSAEKIRTYLGNGKTNCPLTINGGKFTNANLKFVGTGNNESDTDIKVTVNGGDFQVTIPQQYLGTPLAQIGSVNYGTLDSAVAAVPTDGTATTIKMLADYDVTAALTIANTKNITLDLNGKTVKNEASKSLDQLVTVNGKLTIDDNSADKNGKIQNTASAKYVIKTGTAASVLTLKNGTIETTTGNGNGAVYGTNGAFVMTGGKVIAAGTGVTSKNVNISGGQITATAGQALCGAGTITGGTFTSINNNAVYANQSGTLEITGGEFTGVSTKPTINIYTTDVKVTGATLNNGVGFASNATAMVLPGSDDAYLANTHAAFYDGETLVGYAPINTGLFASSKVSGKTVKLTKDVATTTYLNVTKSFTLDLNNHNITCTPAKADATILTKGTTSAPVELTIKGEGKVSCGDHGEGCNAIQVGNCTTLNIEGGEFEVPGDNSTIYIVTTANTEAAKSIVNISGGVFRSGDGKYILNIKDDVRAYNTFNVTGGTFHGFNPADNNAEGEHTNFVAEGYESVNNGDGTYTVKECEYIAQIGDVKYLTFAAAVAAAQNEDEIVVLSNYEGTDDAPLIVVDGKTVTLNLNGHTIEGSGCDGVIWAKNSANVTIQGNGTVIANECKNCDPSEGYGYAVRATSNSTITIKDGSYKLKAYNLATQKDMIYASGASTINIEGGNFESDVPGFTLNLRDNSGSKMSVTGGTFVGFNPADNAAEGAHTNFVAEGYESVDNGDGTWTVKQILVSIEVPEEVVTDVPESATEEEKAAAKEAVEELSKNTAITSEGATNVAEQEDINILVIKVKSATVDTTPASGDTPAQAIITKVTYDVQPMQNGDPVNETDNLISFRLPVPANFSNTVKVGHQHDNNVTWTYEVVVGEGYQRYVELSSSLFSEWTVENLTGSNFVSIKRQNHNPVQVPVGNEITIDDNGDIENLIIASDLNNVNVTYLRDIKSSYQAWYVPFDYIITDTDKENKIQFLKIWSLDIDPSTGLATDVIGKVLAPGEILKANTPYMVAAFGDPGHYTFTANGLKATAYNTISCTTTERAYTFNGTYMALDLANNPYWALSQSGVFNYWNSDAIENAMRFVMMIYDKESGSVIDPHYHSAAPVRVKIVGEDGVTETTGIPVVDYDDNVSGAAMHGCYDLSGRKINNPVSNGIYVINGKKCLK